MITQRDTEILSVPLTLQSFLKYLFGPIFGVYFLFQFVMVMRDRPVNGRCDLGTIIALF